MKKGNIKRHIISLRVSTEEWDALQETMRGLQMKRVSDLMRAGFRELLDPSASFHGAAHEGQKRTG